MCGIAFGCGLVDEGRIRETNYDQGYSGRWWKQGNDEKHGFVCIAPQRFATSRCPPCFHQCPHRVPWLVTLGVRVIWGTQIHLNLAISCHYPMMVQSGFTHRLHRSHWNCVSSCCQGRLMRIGIGEARIWQHHATATKIDNRSKGTIMTNPYNYTYIYYICIYHIYI